MDPLQLLLILRAHYKVVLAVALLTMAIALGVNELLPKKYTATTAVLVDIKSPDPVAALFAPASLATQVDIISSERVAQRVVRTLGLAEGAKVREQWMKATEGKGTVETWLSGLLLGGLAVAPSRDSNIVNISYTGGDPAFVAAVANSFAQSYIDVTIELKVDPARQYARWFGEQGKTLRDSLEKAQSKVYAFQQQKGIVSREEKLDTEGAKLSELTTQLVKVQSETNDARSKQRSGNDTLSEVRTDAVVAGLRSEIGRQEAKLQEAGINLGSNHPQYLRMQSELAALKQRLEVETGRVSSGFVAASTVGSDREAKLRSAIDVQKRKLLDIRSERDQLAVLQRDVDAAKNADDEVAKRLTETNLASHATQANVSVLTPAMAPIAPSFPKPLAKTLVMAIGLGIFCGLASAFLLEMLSRRIRSAADLATALPLPLLGVITRNKRRYRLLPALRSSPALIAR
ncbi:MAG: chain length determinant protein EpsF [Burkholderiales bacterium]